MGSFAFLRVCGGDVRGMNKDGGPSSNRWHARVYLCYMMCKNGACIYEMTKRSDRKFEKELTATTEVRSGKHKFGQGRDRLTPKFSLEY